MSIMQGLIEPVEFGDSNIEMFLKRKLDKKKAQSPKNNLLNKNDESSEDFVSNGKTAMVRGHVFDQTGYGKVNRNLAKILSQMGYEVNLDSTSSFKLQLTKKELEEIKKFTIGMKNVDLQIDSIIPTFRQLSL